MTKMITLKTIAQHFGVSMAAISKALNGLPGVSDDLRTAVIAYAKENSYVPNVYGKGLKGKAPKVIGVIVTDYINPSFSRLVKGVEIQAEKFGYNIILCNSEDKWEKELRYLDMLVHNGVLGIVLVPAQLCANEPANRYAILERFDIPYVFMSRTLDGYNCSSVTADNFQSSVMAMEFLIEKGHRKIIHLTTTRAISTAFDRMRGYKYAMGRHGLPVRESDIHVICDIDRDASTIFMNKILEARRRFTAIFAFNDNMAFGCMKALHSRKIRIPEDVAIVGYDDNGFADISLVPLTTVPQESEYLGSLAFEMVMEIRKNRRLAPIKKVLPPSRIIERSSA